MNEQNKIRNFCIIAHIDHGKSTLADCFIRLCGGLSDREMQDQVLDSMDIERERGITIKAQSVTLKYKSQYGVEYIFNIIDTPGHVDFSYEVSRSLAACEGALLLVDAVQGVEAQTVAVCNMAVESNLEIIPVINKIDLYQAEPERVVKEIEEIIGISRLEAIKISAKCNFGVIELMEEIVARISPPKGGRCDALQALIIDSWFDNYLGVVSLVRVVNGTLRAREKIIVMSTGREYVVDSVGVFTPKRRETDELSSGEVGYVIANIKDIFGAPVGDTFTTVNNKALEPLAGFKKAKPQVYTGLYTIRSDDFEKFRSALSKLNLNDASLFYEPETSEALGLGFRCGFLGILHMEIVVERLEREYGLNLILSAPTVIYKVIMNYGEKIFISNPAKLPDIDKNRKIMEPIVKVNILLPRDYLGSVIQLCMDRRGCNISIDYLERQVLLICFMPMSEVILDFFDRIKSITKGYASLEYSFDHFAESDLIKLDILINGEKIDAFTSVVHRKKAYERGKKLVEVMKDLIPRQLFEVVIQAAIGSRILVKQTVKALRKNVLAKCYGGDVTRKRKLLEKQKEGKKKMKRFGKIDIPQEVFVSVLKI